MVVVSRFVSLGSIIHNVVLELNSAFRNPIGELKAEESLPVLRRNFLLLLAAFEILQRNRWAGPILIRKNLQPAY